MDSAGKAISEGVKPLMTQSRDPHHPSRLCEGWNRLRIGARFACLSEPAASQQVGKALLRTEWVPFGIHGEKDEMYVVGVVAALQPFESKLELTQSGMHHRHGIRGDLSFPGDGQQRLQYMLSLFNPAHAGEDVTAQRHDF